MQSRSFEDLRAALGRIDAQLAAEFSGLRAPAGFDRRVLQRTAAPRPTRVPEILDSIGWASVIAAVAAVAWVVVAPLSATW
ncbi:MAG: hypothetical protein ACM336_15415 [Acidobacteriota bacterium]